ncbi:peptidoglycan DD-metalloendopeptidase family protein [Streptomyces sp. NPDC087850]|uniref:peptidoglycan DD-metalloendopeptidase family protein n=1 Tax=Streptomyces sp. NPDC087850 TaxID=3365809 RepID=UPI0037FABCAF
MAEPTVVGRTRVSLIPDTSKFGDLLRVELPPIATKAGKTAGDALSDAIGARLKIGLPGAMRQAGQRMQPIATQAGSAAADAFATGFEVKLQARLAKMKPTVKVAVDLDTKAAETWLTKLAADRTIKLGVQLDDRAAATTLGKLAADRTVRIRADLDKAAATQSLRGLTATRQVRIVAALDDKTVRAALDRLTADRTVKVTAQIDDQTAKTKLAALGQGIKATVDVQLKQGAVDRTRRRLAALGADITANISPKIVQSAYKLTERQLARLVADRVVNIRTNLDTRVAAEELRNLVRRQRVRIGVDVDTRVAADDIANLTRRRTLHVTTRANTTAANTAINAATRDRTVNVRLRTLGLGTLGRTLGSVGGDGSSSGIGVGILANKIVVLGTAIASSIPTLASFSSAVAQLGPLAAVTAPAITLLGASVGALLLGFKGVGGAITEAFADTSAEAKAAATATKQVETAQRSLVRAQRGVGDAERSLTQAQRDARQAQDALSAARRQATRDLEDMNQRLRQGALDQKQAALDIEQAELDLQKVRSDPAATQLQIRQADLALQKARAAADEQARQQKRLAVDAKAANKAGVDGSDAMVAAREKIRQANERVVAQERALADAHQAVTDAARTVAEAQQSAAAQTSKLNQALADISPNARLFVAALQAIAPAWSDVKLDVQDALFARIGQRMEQISGQILPTVRTGLVGTARELNLMGHGALTAVENLEKTGQLKQVFDGVRTSLGNLRDIPGQFVTGLAQLSIAARPAFARITKGAGEAMDGVMGKLAKGLENGKLEESINTALDVAVQFGKVIGDLFGILKNVMGAAADAGGDFFGVIGKAIEEIRRITALPEVQDALKAIFTALQAIAVLLAGTLGAVLQAVLPLLAAIAPVITELAKALGPVLGALAQALGEALMPLIEALLPVIDMVGKGIIDIVVALLPLLQPIGDLIGAIITALAPVLEVIVDVIVTLVGALVGPLSSVIAALIPAVELIGGLISSVLVALMPALEPLLDLAAQLAATFAGLFVQAIQALLPALMPLIPVIVQVVTILAQLLAAVMVPLAPIITQVAELFGRLLTVAIGALAPIIKSVAETFVKLLPALLPLIPALVGVVAAVLQLLPTLLELLLAVLVPLLPVIVSLAGLLVGVLGKALLFLVPIVVKVIEWVAKFVTKIVEAVKGIVNWFKWLFDVLLGHSIIPDIVRGAIKWFTDLKDKALRLFIAIKDGIKEKWQQLWDAVKTTASDAWGAVRRGFDKFADGLTKAFDVLKQGLGRVWSGLKDLVKSPVKFWIETVYNGGIVKVWNATAGKIPGIPDLKPMSTPKGFARGGILPGQSSWRGGDTHLRPMREGEGVYVSEAMRDPYERARLHAVNQAAMRGQSLRAFRGFAEGGIVGSIGDAVSSVLSKGADTARGGLADLAEAAFKPIKSGIAKRLGTNTGTWPGMIAAAPIGFIGRAIDYIRGKDVVEGTGEWLKPVNAPYGTPFGKAGAMWSSGRHTGLDFPAKTGTPIRAVDSGLVAAAVSGGPYGQHITIDHGKGLTSLYAHMSAMLARASDTVKRGQQIGRVGATGNVTGPHLHLEARINGTTVDPMRYLEGGTGGPAGAGVERFRGVVTQALGQVRQSLSLANTTLRRMNQESGGNPNAVNRNDINWINGTPSVGLMQVIKPTFAAYAGKYKTTGPFMYGVSTDPMANIYASMRYALSRYGSLSKAYNRIGGYAKGGTARPGELAWVGEAGAELMQVFNGGVKIFNHRQSKAMARSMGQPIPGYASGGTITVGGKKIDTGPLKASVGGDFLKQLAGTAAQIDKAMTGVATALKNAFKGVKTSLDDKLIAQVKAQNVQLKKLATERDKIAATIATATTFAKDTTANASGFASMTGLPNSGLPFGAEGILNGLNVRLGQLKAFSANLTTLGKRGLSKELIGQLIAAGPDQGAPYAAALVQATDAQLKSINETQAQIGKASSSYGQAAANAMYDAGAMSGKGFLSGLKAQEASIIKAMSDLAKKVQKAIRVELKISSPSRIMDTLGRFTGLGFARGVRATIPQAAAAAASMARTVRSTAAASAARTQVNTSNVTSGDRVLNYNALVRETASRRSVLDALAHEDMLHRPVMSGA